MNTDSQPGDAMLDHYVLSAETDSPQLAAEVATALREWIASRDPGIRISQDRAKGEAQDLEGSLLMLLAIHAAGHILGHTAYELVHAGVQTIQTKYGVRFHAKAPDGKEGPAEELLPKSE
jgi:hypothetical protein